MSDAPPSYVRRADDDQIIVCVQDHNIAAQLRDSGYRFTATADEAYLRVDSDEGKAAEFAKLRDAGICFAYGREWSPSELFEWFRKRNLLSGSYRQIAWQRPDEWIVREC